MHLGADDVTTKFALTRKMTLSGVLGLQVMRYITERWAVDFHVGASDDGKRLKCQVVTPPGVCVNTTYVRILVHCKCTSLMNATDSSMLDIYLLKIILTI